MKLVKSKPRYKCDFCRFVAGLEAVTNHEKICWKNPNRFCELCKNSGEITVDDIGTTIPCPFCSRKKEVGQEIGL